MLTITFDTLLFGFRLFLISSSKASFVDQLGQLLLDKFVYFSDGSVQAFFRGARDMEIERRVLGGVSTQFTEPWKRKAEKKEKPQRPHKKVETTHSSGGHGLIRKVTAARSYVFQRVNMYPMIKN